MLNMAAGSSASKASKPGWNWKAILWLAGWEKTAGIVGGMNHFEGGLFLYPYYITISLPRLMFKWEGQGFVVTKSGETSKADK